MWSETEEVQDVVNCVNLCPYLTLAAAEKLQLLLLFGYWYQSVEHQHIVYTFQPGY